MINKISYAIHQASFADMAEVAILFRKVRRHSLPYLPELHSPDEDKAYFSDVVFPKDKVYVARVPETKSILGFIAFNQEFIDHLYILPEAQGMSIGTQLLMRAKEQNLNLSLWTFQKNHAAQSFYLKRGFEIIKKTDGIENEEKEPDILFSWRNSKLKDLSLNPMTIEDVAGVFSLWSDGEAVKFTNWPYVSTLDECKDRLTRTVEYYGKNPLHFGPLSIQVHDDKFAGIIGADAVNSRQGQYEVWYFIRRDQWRRGIARAALTELLKIMAASGRVDVITATAVVENSASWRLLEKLGFERQEQISRGHQKHGLELDLFKYSLTVSDAEKIL